MKVYPTRVLASDFSVLPYMIAQFQSKGDLALCCAFQISSLSWSALLAACLF